MRQCGRGMTCLSCHGLRLASVHRRWVFSSSLLQLCMRAAHFILLLDCAVVVRCRTLLVTVASPVMVNFLVKRFSLAVSIWCGEAWLTLRVKHFRGTSALQLQCCFAFGEVLPKYDPVVGQGRDHCTSTDANILNLYVNWHQQTSMQVYMYAPSCCFQIVEPSCFWLLLLFLLFCFCMQMRDWRGRDWQRT